MLRIQCALVCGGVHVGVRAVAASMRRRGLRGLHARPRQSKRGGRPPVTYEDRCARQWDQGALDRVWTTDFTYLHCAQGWVYLCAVRDVHSRRVLGYAMGEQQSTDLVITALDMAATTRGGLAHGVVLHAENRVLLPAYLHHPRPGRHLDGRFLQLSPHPHQPRRKIPIEDKLYQAAYATAA